MPKHIKAIIIFTMLVWSIKWTEIIFAVIIFLANGHYLGGHPS